MKIVNNTYAIMYDDAIHTEDCVLVINDPGTFHIQIQEKQYHSLKEIPQKQLLNVSHVLFVLDFSQSMLDIKEAGNIMVQIKNIEKWSRRQHLTLGVKQDDYTIIAYIKRGTSPYEANIETALGIMTYQAKKEKYEYLYDEICEYLDQAVVSKNVCGFENNTCIGKRNTTCMNGCCHHYKNKYFGILYERKLQLCEYQVDKRCEAKCITCKMFMCDELKKRGVYFTNRNVLLIRYYLNPIQKLIIKTSFFTPKEKILQKLCFVAIK